LAVSLEYDEFRAVCLELAGRGEADAAIAAG
jgi:hypothetical protein